MAVRGELGAFERRGHGVLSPYGLNIIEDCLTCKVRQERVFCNLPQPALKALDGIKSLAVYPKGSLLFVQGQPARGVFLLCMGRAKLTISSKDGRAMILRVAEPGEILGVDATLSGKPYYMTAETLAPAEVNFIKREVFLRFLRENGEACMRVAQQLAMNSHTANEQIRLLGLSSTASAKLARFLLRLASQGGQVGSPLNVKLSFTHQDMAEMIGISRETVTRHLKKLKKEHIILLNGSALVIRDKAALEAIASR